MKEGRWLNKETIRELLEAIGTLLILGVGAAVLAALMALGAKMLETILG